MKALTAVAAVAYAIGLWMFAPLAVWRREVEQARRNQQPHLTRTPEPIQQPQTEPIQTPETEASAQPGVDIAKLSPGAR